MCCGMTKQRVLRNDKKKGAAELQTNGMGFNGSLCRFGGGLDGLDAEFAARGGDWNVAEALGAGFCGWSDRSGMEFFEEVLGWQDEEEVDDGGDEEEVHDRREEVAVADLASVDVGDQVAEVGLADDGSEQWIDDLFGEGGDDSGKSRSDDDGDGEVHDVATEDEVAESLEHECLLGKDFDRASGVQGTG
jgi:hypothetical protein